MSEKETIELLVEGGKASPGPSTAPKFAAYKIKIGDVFKEVNEKTASYAGIKVPVKIIGDSYQLKADMMSLDLNTNKTVFEGRVEGAFSENFSI